jgi:hypothetical protein
VSCEDIIKFKRELPHMWDEEKLDGFYTDENLMKRERKNVGNLEGQKKRQLMMILFFVVVSWVVCLLQVVCK